VLALIGQGCHRISEIGARLGVPATSLSRPLDRLIDLGFVQREVPYGRSLRDTKRTHYRLADPFLRFWYRFVEPNRSRLAVGQIEEVARAVERAWPQFLGQVWQDAALDSVPKLEIAGTRWGPASRWWGPGRDGESLEIDVVATSIDEPRRMLAGEAKLTSTPREARALLAALEQKARLCPELAGKNVVGHLFVMRPRGRLEERVTTASEVVTALR
jgi:AAA+ ATPase superfamily predicted ATPase